jgi:hypothetical protein
MRCLATRFFPPFMPSPPRKPNPLPHKFLRNTPSLQCNTLLGYDYKIRAETLPDAGQSSDTNLDRSGATISWTPINAVGGVGDQSQLLSMDNYMAARSYSPTDPTPTSDGDADFDIDEHDETDDEFSEEGSEFETPEPSRRKSVTTGKKISTNGAGVVSSNMESPSMGSKANARKGQGKPGTRVKKDTESLLSLRFSERRDCIDYFNILRSSVNLVRLLDNSIFFKSNTQRLSVLRL